MGWYIHWARSEVAPEARPVPAAEMVQGFAPQASPGSDHWPRYSTTPIGAHWYPGAHSEGSSSSKGEEVRSTLARLAVDAVPLTLLVATTPASPVAYSASPDLRVTVDPQIACQLAPSLDQYASSCSAPPPGTVLRSMPT